MAAAIPAIPARPTSPARSVSPESVDPAQSGPPGAVGTSPGGKGPAAPAVPLPPHVELAQSAFLAAYRAALVEEVARSAPPVYEGPASIPTARLGLLKRRPLGAQALAILAGATGVRGRRPVRRAVGDVPGQRRTEGLGLVMEMGCGKTFCALAILAMADEEVTRVAAPPDVRAEKSSFFPALVLCPPILQEKWAREAEQTLPNARVVILRPLTTRAEVAAFRRFDPAFRGTHLSALGVAERIVTRIDAELAQWRAACARARAAGRRIPAKPCHVVVISQGTAKFGLPWTPVYVLRALRQVDDDGHVHLQRTPETGEPVVVPCCPSCFAPIAEDERHANARTRRQKRRRQASSPDGDASVGAGVVEGDEDLEGLLDVWNLPYLEEADLLGVDRPRLKRTCAACGEALWQAVPQERATWLPVPPPLDGVTRTLPPLPLPHPGWRPPHLVVSTAQRRYPVADYLRRRHTGVFRSLIADEAHQLKGAGTAQGYAAASLVDACGPDGTTLFLTGTLFSGYASDMFPMLWRLMPALRRHFAYDEVARWVRLYGVRQKQVRVDVTPGAARGGTRSKRNEAVPRFRELPGISPLVLNLLPHCLFLELADVAPDLPPYREDIITIPLGDVLAPTYATFESESTATLRALLLRGDNSGTSAWFHGLMIWPNLPCDGLTPTAKRSGVILGVAPSLAAEVAYPKERALLDLVRRERAEGRRCLVYVEHTGEHDLLPRLARLLAEDDARWREEDPDDHPGGAEGPPIRVAILRGETVPSAGREAWLARQVEAGCDVLLCHSGLVEVGLDLLAFPTILVYEVIFSTTRWRQAIRRSWRPGQTREVRVLQLAYERTMEARGLRLIATKAISSLLIEGKMPSASLTAQAETNATASLIMELFEQVTAEAAAAPTVDVVDAGTGAAPEAREVHGIQAAFRALGQAEREADQFIGVGGEGGPADAEDEAYSAIFGVEPDVPDVGEVGEADEGALWGGSGAWGDGGAREAGSGHARASSEPATAPGDLVCDSIFDPGASRESPDEGTETGAMPAAGRPATNAQGATPNALDDALAPYNMAASTTPTVPVLTPPALMAGYGSGGPGSGVGDGVGRVESTVTTGQPALDIQVRRTSWDDMRRQLDEEKRARKRARRGHPAGDGAPAFASLWDVAPTSGPAAAALVAPEAGPHDQDATASVEVPGSPASVVETAPSEAGAPADVGQLSLFGSGR